MKLGKLFTFCWQGPSSCYRVLAAAEVMEGPSLAVPAVSLQWEGLGVGLGLGVLLDTAGLASLAELWLQEMFITEGLSLAVMQQKSLPVLESPAASGCPHLQGLDFVALKYWRCSVCLFFITRLWAQISLSLQSGLCSAVLPACAISHSS